MELKTGDILLFNSHSSSLLSSLIRWGTHSNYTHVAMVLKDPTFIHPCLKGTFVWESSWEGAPDPQDGKVKLGVQITPLQEIIDSYGSQNIFVRKIDCNENSFSKDRLKYIHSVVYDKPYDVFPLDWIGALFRKDTTPQKTDRFWCSALVGYIYTQCGILEPETDWSILRPSDFSIAGEKLNFYDNAKLGDCETRIK